MNALVAHDDDETGLRSIQRKVRKLALAHPWLAREFQKAFYDFVLLTQAHTRAKSAMWKAKRRLLRQLLASDKLVDPRALAGAPVLFVTFNGLCPVDLAEEYKKYADKHQMPFEFQRRAAKHALKELNTFEKYNSPNTPKAVAERMAAKYRNQKESGAFVEKTWHLSVIRPDEWEEPSDPHSIDHRELRRFSDEDYRTIALYHLGGLADLGAHRPIVAEPVKSKGQHVRTFLHWLNWRSRWPTSHDQWDAPSPRLAPSQFPFDTAEQMFQWIRAWISRKQPRSRANRTLASAREKARRKTKLRPADTELIGLEEAVWLALDGTALMAHELAKLPTLNTNEDVVRKAIGGIRAKLGPGAIQTRRGLGYFRIDKPPEWDRVTRRPRRHFRAE